MFQRVYKYGLRAPTGRSAELVREQFEIARDYRRALIRVEAQRRMLRLEIMCWSPSFREARQAALEARERKIEACRLAREERKATGRRALSADMKWWLDSAKEDDRAATSAFMEVHRRVVNSWPFKGLLDDVIQRGVSQEHATLREEYGQSGRGLYWSTYNFVANQVQDASKSTPEFGRMINRHRVPGPDHHCPKDADGSEPQSIAAQLQGGLSVSEALAGSDSQLQILEHWDVERPVPLCMSPEKSERLRAHRERNAQRRANARSGQPWEEQNRQGVIKEMRPSAKQRSMWRQRARQHLLRVTVGGTGPGNRTPIWVSFPLILDRPLPPAGIISSVSVTMRRVGPMEEWSCQITVRESEHRAGLVCGSGVCGIDIGWRKVGDDLRVATIWGEDGCPAIDIRLSRDLLDRFKTVANLKSGRDKDRDRFLPRFKAALSKIELPRWLETRIQHLERWESCNRIQGLLALWNREGRFAGDKAAYTMLSGYCYRDQHLWKWEDSLRKKILRRRREGYRVIAAAIAETYEVVVLESFDLSDMAMRKQVGEDTAENDIARSNRSIAATSELRDAIIKACRARGGTPTAVPPNDTTRECHITRMVEVFDAAAQIRHRTAMGTEWDQDDNAARNLVQRYRERPSGAEILGGARKDKKTGEVVEMAGGRFRRAKGAKVRMALENGTARNGPANDAE